MKETYDNLIGFLDALEKEDKEVRFISHEKRAELQEMVRTYFEDESSGRDLADILEHDDYLTELLVDKVAYLNIVESELGENPAATLKEKQASFSKAEVEEAYLSVIDTLFELSKPVNPLGGFGKDRLLAGLSMIKSFEERFWSLATLITRENAEAFKEFIPSEYYDDILVGRKRAIGAIRTVENKACAAGAVVYTVPKYNDDFPMIRLDWIMVHEDMREKGIGNFLMAQVLELTLQYEGMGVIVDLPAKVFEDETEASDLQILYNCLDNWDYLFDLIVGNRFVLKISDCRGNELIDVPAKNVISVGNLGKRAAEMIGDFFAETGRNYDEDLKNLPVDFFDQDVSCTVVADGKIRALLLFHRMEDGNLRYEGLRMTGDPKKEDILNLLRFAYGVLKIKNEEDNMIFGGLGSEEGLEFLGSVIPGAQITMLYRGILLPEEENLSSEEWDALRKKAGLSDEKIPDEGINDELIGDEEIRLIKNILKEAFV